MKDMALRKSPSGLPIEGITVLMGINELLGSGLGRQETNGGRGSRKRTKAGMSQKRRGISICHRPIKVLEHTQAGVFAPGNVDETNPRGLRYTVATTYKNSGQNKPNPVMFRAVYRLQRKSAYFSANLNADDPSRILSLNHCPIRPSADYIRPPESQVAECSRGTIYRGFRLWAGSGGRGWRSGCHGLATGRCSGKCG